MIRVIQSHWASLVTCFLILILCNLPKSAMPSVAGFLFLGFDKVVHLLLFFTLSSVMLISEIIRLRSVVLPLKNISYILIFNLIFGAFIEILQLEVFTYRSAEWWDLICDGIGAIMCLFLYFFIHIFSSKV